MADYSPEDYFVIGIGGVTNGGKTSLCEYLKQKFPAASTINMDDYYWPDEDPHHIWLEEFKYADWDVITSIDFKRLTNDVRQWVTQTGSKPTADAAVAGAGHPPILLVEGILIFNDETLLPFFRKKYFFTLTKEQCWERRKLRVYEPPEPEGYFDAKCWPWYLKYKQDLQHLTDIVYLDGSANQQQVYSHVYEDILRLVESR